jgi:hypothetical protein
MAWGIAHGAWGIAHGVWGTDRGAPIVGHHGMAHCALRMAYGASLHGED